MKKIRWKVLFITCLVCLLPILFGVAVWDDLPDRIAIHFDINNNPDNYASKGFAVFALPALMVLIQAFACITNDINASKYGGGKKAELILKMILPVVFLIMYIFTLGYAMGWNVDARKIASLLVGGILLVMGLTLRRLEYIKNYNISVEKARKINNFIGIESAVMGALFMVSTFLPTAATIGCMILLIPYAVIAAWYGIKTGK